MCLSDRALAEANLPVLVSVWSMLVWMMLLVRWVAWVRRSVKSGAVCSWVRISPLFRSMMRWSRSVMVLLTVLFMACLLVLRWLGRGVVVGWRCCGVGRICR